MENPPQNPQQPGSQQFNPQQSSPNAPPYSQPLSQPLYSQPPSPNYPPQPSYTQPLQPPPYSPYQPYAQPASQPLPPGYTPNYQQIPPQLPYPGYPVYSPSLYARQQQDNAAPLVLEAVCALFGIYGIGWLMRGRIVPGIALLIGGLIWTAIALAVVILTAGFGALCFFPLHIIFIVSDTLMLNSSLRHP